MFGLLLVGCFIPFQAILLADGALILGFLGRRLTRSIGSSLGFGNTTVDLVLVHVVYGIAFTTLFFRNFLRGIPDRTREGGAYRRRRLLPDLPKILLPISLPIFMVTLIWQFTKIWNDFLFGSCSRRRFVPITVALNNLVNTSTGVRNTTSTWPPR